MTYKSVDKIVNNWRESYQIQRIYHPGIDLLEEAVNRRQFVKG